MPGLRHRNPTPYNTHAYTHKHAQERLALQAQAEAEFQHERDMVDEVVRRIQLVGLFLSVGMQALGTRLHSSSGGAM